MDTIITFNEFSHLVHKTSENYKHFDKMYHQKLVDFHKDELMLETYKHYLEDHKQSYNEMVVAISHKLRVIKSRMKFAQEELTMYKHEMMKWRDISHRLYTAYHKLYKQIETVWHSSNGLKFGHWITVGNKTKCNGFDIKLHMRITNYTNHGNHQIIIALLDKEFGTLTNEQVF